MKRGKNYIDSKKLIESNKLYDSAEAMALAIEGTGRTVRVLVIAKGAKADEAAAAGADYVGAEDMIQKITSENWFEFDAVVTTPDMMGLVGRLGKILGPKGLMPNPKSGTVTMDVTRAIHDIKAGKVEYRVDKTAEVLRAGEAHGQLQHRHGSARQGETRGGEGTVSQERLHRLHDGSQREDPLQDRLNVNVSRAAPPRGERTHLFYCVRSFDKKPALCYNKRVPETASGESLNECLPRSVNTARVFVIPLSRDDDLFYKEVIWHPRKFSS